MQWSDCLAMEYRAAIRRMQDIEFKNNLELIINRKRSNYANPETDMSS